MSLLREETHKVQNKVLKEKLYFELKYLKVQLITKVSTFNVLIIGMLI